MMTIGGISHIGMVIASLVFSTVLVVVVARSKEKVQYGIITTIGVIAWV